MLIKEKDSLLEQINMYNDINLECFERIKELKTTVDKQYVILQKIQVEETDLNHIRSILGTSDDMYDKTIGHLYYCFEMIQSRFNNYNLRLYEIIKHYSS